MKQSETSQTNDLIMRMKNLQQDHDNNLSTCHRPDLCLISNVYQPSFFSSELPQAFLHSFVGQKNNFQLLHDSMDL